MVEIGILGFYSNRRVVDLCGLVTPEVGPHLALGDVSWPVRSLSPDFVILHEPLWNSLEEPIASADWFQNKYSKVKTFAGEEPYILALYKRTDSDTDVAY